MRVEDLAEQIGVSTVTIRSDLAYLEEQGLIMRANGGARAVRQFHAVRRDQHAPLAASQRRDMISAIVPLVGSSMTVLLGSGILPALLPPYLPASSQLRLIITSLEALPAARQYSLGPVYLLGGQCHSGRAEIDGPTAVQALAAYDIDLFVMEIAGISTPDAALRTLFSQALHAEAIRAARRTIALLNPDGASEAEVPELPVFLHDIDYLITPENPGPAISRTLHQAGFSHNAEADQARLYRKHILDQKNHHDAISA
ncbi:DeoR family transcriptional regulator [Neoasaia chiangmaiensis NBRC 101099]|nr:DeoR family transcriptional regulator [Neoasaia chiangmaiensis NBRC 101099]GEN15313.1 DeoR family transcriptional regulator [Neoasaia chiangmaiensis]